MCGIIPKRLAKYARIIPEQPERIPRGLYQPEPIGNSLTGSRTAGTDTDRTGICWKRSEQPRTISAGTDTALSYRPRRNDSAVCNPACDGRNSPDNISRNRADGISLSQYHAAADRFSRRGYRRNHTRLSDRHEPKQLCPHYPFQEKRALYRSRPP